MSGKFVGPWLRIHQVLCIFSIKIMPHGLWIKNSLDSSLISHTHIKQIQN